MIMHYNLRKRYMSFPKLGTLLIIAGTILAFSSCKKEEEQETIPTLTGSLSFEVESYVSPNTVLKMKPSGVTHPDGKGIGYYWKVTPGMEKADTTRFETGLDEDGKQSDGSFTYTFKGDLQTYTVTCTAFAKGYANTYSTRYVALVKNGLDGSLTGTGIQASDDHIPGDGTKYYYVSHNGLDWMRNNLAETEAGAPYHNIEIMSDIFGRFYSHEEAVTACPDGWRLPTDKEWTELAASVNGKAEAAEYETIEDIAADFMADAQFNQNAMWEYWPEVGEITNSSKMAMIPAGYANLGKIKDGKYPSASFRGDTEYAAFWTADKVSGNESMAYYRYLICDEPDMFAGKGDTKSFGANVRCVRESK